MRNKTMKKIISIIAIVLFFFTFAKSEALEDNFEKYAPLANVLEFLYGVPSSIQLAQAYCETGFGKQDTIGYINKATGKVFYRDTIGYHFNNWFSIMDFENDYWIFGSDTAMGAYSKKKYIWRVYLHPVFSWIDHAIFMYVHYPLHRLKNWRFWIDNPVRYGKRGYWRKIGFTVQKFELWKYDIIKHK